MPVIKDSDKEGHINNLSPEQEGKLKEIWKKFFNAVGDARQKAKKAAQDGSVEDEQAKASTKRPSANRSTTAEPKDEDDAKKGQASAAEEAQGLKDLLSKHKADGAYQAFWQFALAEDPDVLMLRFLRARKWDVESAFNMLASTLKWRIETDIQGILAKGEEGLCEQKGVRKNFDIGKSFAHQVDKEGKPIIFAKAKSHRASDQTPDEMLQYIVYQMETSKTLLPLDSGIETSSVVFDLHGLGMGNVDWDTANMVIRIFQSYYPETLGHAVIWNAPTLFSGMWKIVKGMLDPAVKEKIAFASSQKEIAEFIDPKTLSKDFGGNSAWKYRFTDPVAGENDHMKDKETKEKRLAAYQAAASDFEDSTEKWIGGDSSAGEERRKKAKAFAVRRLDADPFIRGKTVFAREGIVVGDGTVVWKADHGDRQEYGTSGNEWASQLGISEPAERPLNKDANDVVLSSSEDTESDTTDSEDDILDDPNHHHHNSVAVGFAKFGDGVANKFSKLGKGPSLHEKRKLKREERHKRHEARRAEKLEAKRKRIEAEQAHQEELEAENQKAEEEGAMDASYQAYLAKFAHLPIDAVAGAATGAATVAQHVKEATVGVEEEDDKKAKKESKKAGNALGDNLPAILAVLVAIVVAYYGGAFLIKSAATTLFSRSAKSAVSKVSKVHKTSSVSSTHSSKHAASSATASPKSLTETVITSVVTKVVSATTIPAQESPATVTSSSSRVAPRSAAPPVPVAGSHSGKGRVEILDDDVADSANPGKVTTRSVAHPFSSSASHSASSLGKFDVSDSGDLVQPAFSPAATPSSNSETLGTPVRPAVTPSSSGEILGTPVEPASSARTTLSHVEILD